MKKLSKLLLLTPLVPLSLVSCVSQGSTEEHKNNKNNNIETIRNLLDNEQSNPVLSNWYKNGYEEYAQLKELQDQGQNIDSMVQKLKENLETQKMVLLLSSDVYRKSETKYIWEINKIGSLLGLNDQNSNQDNEVEIEGGLKLSLIWPSNTGAPYFPPYFGFCIGERLPAFLCDVKLLLTPNQTGGKSRKMER